MFKPIAVKVDSIDAHIHHEIELNPFYVTSAIQELVARTGKTVIVTVACAALITTASEIAIHIAKTKIK